MSNGSTRDDDVKAQLQLTLGLLERTQGSVQAILTHLIDGTILPDRPHVQFVRTRVGAQHPQRAHDSDAGYDIFVCLEDEVPEHAGTEPAPQVGIPHWSHYIGTPAGKGVVLPRGRSTRVPVGIAVAPPPGYCFRLTARSSTQFFVREGIIDPGYRGEIMVPVQNIGVGNLSIRSGMKIAQLLLQRVIDPEFEEVDTLPTSDRGLGAFGSTGGER
jgi:dUTP pyrophosphatase